MVPVIVFGVDVLAIFALAALAARPCGGRLPGTSLGKDEVADVVASPPAAGLVAAV